jgi:hypothetical protein
MCSYPGRVPRIPPISSPSKVSRINTPHRVACISDVELANIGTCISVPQYERNFGRWNSMLGSGDWDSSQAVPAQSYRGLGTCRWTGAAHKGDDQSHDRTVHANSAGLADRGSGCFRSKERDGEVCQLREGGQIAPERSEPARVAYLNVGESETGRVRTGTLRSAVHEHEASQTGQNFQGHG